MKRCVLALALLSIGIALYAQTNPTPFDLRTGDYSLTAWDASNPPGTYPPNMAFHVFSRADNNLQPDTANVVGDYTGAYNLTSGTRINGLGTDGFAFLNTASPGNLGAAVLAINTTNRVNIRISWKAGTLASNFTGFRYYSILLQYRVGTSGPWQTAIIGTDTVQYNANIQGQNVVAETVTMPTFTLPQSCENQPVVQIRWRYYQRYPQTSGNRPQLKVDDILVQSDPNTGIPTKLAITAITPSSPSANAPFSVTIQAQNDNNQPRNVQSATSVVLELVNGTGTLGGTLTGTIAAGSNTLTISGVTYNVAESNVQIRVRRTAGDNLASGVSAPFTVLPAATQLTVESFPQYAFTQTPLPAFTVTARRPDGSVDTHFPYTCSLVVQSGPSSASGTTSVMHVNGVAQFTNVIFNTPGTYRIVFQASNLTSSPQTLTVVSLPSVAELIIPQYMLSANASTRVPVWALIRLDNLQPNTTYRYFVGADSVPQVTATIGAGNNLHYNANTQTFNYTTTRDFTVPGGYSEFRTGAGQTSKTLWINLVATANVRFTEGNTMYWLITILDSNRALQTRLVTMQGTKALYFGSASNKVSGMVDSASGLQPKSIVCLYDDITGSSRPVATAIVQDEGTTVTSAAPFYAAIDSLSGAFATVVPNSITAIRRIEVRDLQTGALIRSFTDSDGIWGAANTRNPSSGINATSIHTPRIELLTSLAGQSICVQGPLTIQVFIRGVDSAQVELIQDNNPPAVLARGILPGVRTLSLNIPANLAGSSNTYLRVVDMSRPDVFAITGPFTLNFPPRLLNQTRGVTPCAGDTVTLTVLASGTNLRYQWEKDGQPLAGATNPTLVLTYVNQNSSGVYRCRVFGAGSCPNDSSDYITVAVRPPLLIAKQPGVVYAGLGKTAQLSIEVSNADQQTTYQWYRGSRPILDNNRITGSRTPVLVIRNVTQSDYGRDYYCVVTTRCGRVVSDTGELRFSGIDITFDTSPLIVCKGAEAVLEITAQATRPGTLRYQWKHNGVIIQPSPRHEGLGTARLRITNVDDADTGTYTCIVTNEATGDSRESAPRALRLRPPVKILAQSSDSTYCFGDTIRLRLRLSEAARVRLRGRDTVIEIGTLQNLDFAATQYSRQVAGTYTFEVITPCDTVRSQPFTIAFQPPPRIITQPRSQLQLLEGSTLTLSVEAEGTAGEELHYRWYKDGARLPDSIASGPVLTIPSVTKNDRGVYYCVVYGRCDSTVSDRSNVDVISSVDEELSLDAALEVYPQPADECVLIRITVDATRLALVDLLGRTAYSLPLGKIAPTAGESLRIPTSPLPSGVYELVLYRNAEPIARRVVIIQH